ncbi:MAG: hypothetical protein LBF16_14010 [Pseudomonadales bacterium]|jgi:putative ABC transport system permease protein|nr:hypothetical protein [Pseudomonadales bacterium]
MLWLKLAWKEIRNNYKFSLFFVLNLSIGLIGFIALDSFKQSIDEHLQNNSKAILTADLQISSRQPLTEADTALAESLLGKEFSSTDQTSFLSMVAGNGNSRMSQIIGIAAGFPQYGDIVLEHSGSVLDSQARAALLANPEVWVARDLMLTLGLHIGDSLKIGAATFTISDSILADPSSTISVMTSFPAIYMSLASVEATGLIQLGSRISYSRFYKLPPRFDISTLKRDFRELQGNSGDPRRLSLTTHEEQSQDLGRILDYMNNYLGLIALIALFLAGVGAAYLFRSFFTSRFRDMAILMCLGGTPRQAYVMTLVQITLLGTLSALIASALAWLALPLLPALFEGFLPRGFNNHMDLNSLLLALLLGTLGSLICCLPILSKIYDLNPIGLFHENVQPTPVQGHWRRHVASYAPILLVFWALALWQARSLLIGSLFVVGFIIAIGLLGSIAWGILRLCGRFSGVSRVTHKLALRNLERNRLGALSCFLAIGLGALLINLIPQIQKGLEQEISQPTGFELPDFFLFDIQEEQLAPLQNLLAEKGYALAYRSPMLRARLDTVNRAATGEGDETPDEQRAQRRQYNLTYQDTLKNSETLVDGALWHGTWDANSSDLPGISVEQNFARRLGLKLGDVLGFDVQGVPVEGRIMNTRKVDWNSFQPNFFLSFQGGVLDLAPKIFVAAIGKVAEADRLAVQNSIVAALPNVSVINVTQIVARVLDITDQISWAIRVMAYLSIFAGLVVLFSIARYEVKSRFWEINLLKILGANFSDVKGMVQIEFGILGFSAALCGVMLSLCMSWAISWAVFDKLWRFSPLLTGFSVLAISALSVATALAATLGVLRQKPLELLKAV